MQPRRSPFFDDGDEGAAVLLKGGDPGGGKYCLRSRTAVSADLRATLRSSCFSLGVSENARRDGTRGGGLVKRKGAVADHPRAVSGDVAGVGILQQAARFAPRRSAAIMAATMGPPPQASHTRDCKLRERS